MTSQHDKPKRWRPRFSVRTLVVLVTLVCAYAACWGPTKRDGVNDVVASLDAPSASLFEDYGTHFADSEMPLIVGISHIDGTRRYYFWFFGYVAKLPYEREVQPFYFAGDGDHSY